MDITFSCPNCKQQLEADATMANKEIECPSCNQTLTIPEPDPANLRAHSSDAAYKEEKHFKVPTHDGPSEMLIKKANKPLEVAAKESDRKVRLKTIRHTDCVEVGRDRFDDVVGDFLGQVGEENIISVNPIVYTHQDLRSQQWVSDYGVMVIYRG